MVYLTIKNTVFLGDFIDISSNYSDESVDCIIADPPYGVDFESDIYDDDPDVVFSQIPKWIEQFYRILKTGGHVYIFVPTLAIDIWIHEVRKKFDFKNLLSTQSYLGNRFFPPNNFRFDAQYIIFAHKCKGRDFNKVNWIHTSSDWLNDKRNPNPQKYTYFYPSYIDKRIARATPKTSGYVKQLHPNEKSVNLIEKFILMSTDEGEIVADFFMGSGTTAIACIKTNRIFTGSEINKKMVDVIDTRVRNLLNQTPKPKKSLRESLLGVEYGGNN